MSDAQRQVWRRIADEMGLDLQFPEGMKIYHTNFAPTVILKDYGGQNGMVVFARDTHSLEEYEALDKSGYGFSVVELDANTTSKQMKELLDDWGKRS